MPQYEKSPRQRLEWFGFRETTQFATSASNLGVSTVNKLLTSQPRATITAGAVNPVAFPAGIVRGETCSIARLIGYIELYDLDRRQQNVSFEVGSGLSMQQVEDDWIADPDGSTPLASAPDALEDLRASWLWHGQSVWSPQSAGANYTVFRWDANIDSTNSRIFESNDVLNWNTQIRTRKNGATEAVAVNVWCTLMWRCLLRLD